jgi:hypothetical protein
MSLIHQPCGPVTEKESQRLSEFSIDQISKAAERIPTFWDVSSQALNENM